MQPPPQTPEQQQAAYQLYQQQMQQYQQQLQQYNLQNPQNQQPQPQYSFPQQSQYPQYAQQPSYAHQYPTQQNHGYQQNAHSDKVIWVGNLHQDVNENELRDIFQAYGTIDNIKLIHTKACGFISFADAQSATKAHSEMNHQQIHGQEIKIGWGKAENPQGGFGQSQYGGNTGGYDPNQQRTRLPDVNKELPQMQPSRALWVGNVTNSSTETTLRDVFSRFGNVENVRMMIQKNCAFVTYATIEEATSAKNQLDKFRIADTQIRVNFGKA